jgi:methylated-DNA-[protein]-cysteine S-methyltransferase
MKNNQKLIFKSKFGNIKLTSEDERIIHIEFTDKKLINSKSNILNRTKNQIEEYFLNTRKIFSINTSISGTDFQRRVWYQIQQIPYGTFTTYLNIANLLNTSPRAVGNACGKNSILLIIPCHRVIASNGNLTGFSALGGINTKKLLLDHEKL